MVVGLLLRLKITEINRIFKNKYFRPLNPPLKSDPACIAFRSLSASRFLGSVQRPGAGGAG